MKKRLVCLMLALIMTTSQAVSVAASREDELREEQAQTSSQLDSTYAVIDSLEAEKEALAAEIDALDQSLVDVMVQINVLKHDINKKETDIKKTKKDLKAAQQDKKDQYEAMKKRIQYLYENGGDTAWFQMLLESNDISELLTKAEYTQKMYDYDRESLQKFTEVVNQVKDLKAQLEGEMAELVDMKKQQEAQQVALEEQLDAKKAASDDYEAQIAGAQAQADQYAALLRQQSEEIARLEAERIAAEEEARRQAEAAAAAQAAAEEEARRQAEAAAAAEAEEEESYEDDTYTDEDDYSDDSYNEEDDSYSEGETDEYGNVIDSNGSSEVINTGSASTSSGSGQAVVNYALQFVGNPYVWGGTSLTGGADCSGFVQSVYANFGVSLSRTSEAQMYNGVGVSYSEAQPGDLICYGSHIAIYIGNGQIVHASNSAPYPQGGIKVSDNAAYRTILAVRRVI